MTTEEGYEARQRIIAEATGLFIAGGYDGISMREIAAAAGLSKPALYYHFKDKQALLLAILTTNLEEISAIVNQGKKETGPVRQQVSWIFETIMQRGPTIGGIIHLATQELSHLDAQTRSGFSRLYQDGFIGNLAGLLAEGIARGELRPVDPHLATWALLGLVYPLLTTYPGGEPGDKTAIIHAILAIYFDGMAVKAI